MAKTKKRTQNPIRFRKARSDARIGSVQVVIEKKLGVPVGSVIFVGPDGRPLRRNSTISRLKAKWAA